MNREDILQTFIVEAEDLLTALETGLLRLDASDHDVETLNDIFRSAHTIKGSAGLFGLHPVVDFTHTVETVLDELRNQRLAVDADLVGLLLECRDHIAGLIELLPTRHDMLSSEQQSNDTDLLARLNHFLGKKVDAGEAAKTTSPQEAQPAASTSGSDLVVNQLWHVSARFSTDLFRGGSDPLSILRYLDDVAEVRHVALSREALPSFDEFDPESCYLGFEVALDGVQSKGQIAEAFEFVEDECELWIMPPHAALEHYSELLASMPESHARLGETLIACGALTRRELDQVLAMQAGAEAGERQRFGELLAATGAVDEKTVEAAASKQSATRETPPTSRFMRVKADKLDHLIDRVGELVTAASTASVLARASGDAHMSEALEHLVGLVEDIRESSLELRMMPIGETFQRFKRVVHDLGRTLNKPLELTLEGEDTELDKTVIERIGDPLMHLVRNAADHGIESAEQRRSAGKPEVGEIRLAARHDSGSILIEISDDGAGLNVEKIQAKAVERGLIDADQSLDANQIQNLIFAPGFSTAQAVTDVSGRGVGMDVVKQNIESLRGSIEVASEPGQGSVFRIRLPLTLAIIEGFLVRVADSHFVVPLDSVAECVELTPEQRAESSSRDVINLRGEVLPLIKAREHFRLTGKVGKRQNVVVVQHGSTRAGLLVDELHGEQQAVIKPMDRLFQTVKGLGGTTVLGTGEVAFIFDVEGMLQHAVQRDQAQFSVPTRSMEMAS